MKTVYIRVSPKGEVKIEAEGFAGTSCEAATAPYEKALGTPGDREEKPEYYAANETTQQLGL